MLRLVNNSDAEQFAVQDDEALVEAALPYLPLLAKRLHAAVADCAQDHGLTFAQTKAALVLGARGPLTVGEIAAGLGVSMPAASAVVDRLVEVGWVRRDVDPADRRRVLVVPAPPAATLARDLLERRRAQLRCALEALPPEQRPALAPVLQAVASALTADAAAGAPCGPANPSR
ncbi:MAG: MarR family transcriptional regulator [Thermomicrobiales bacterium]|nr:MarR family transcriptional regulator [Thermomicrobiales bacterium]